MDPYLQFFLLLLKKVEVLVLRKPLERTLKNILKY